MSRNPKYPEINKVVQEIERKMFALARQDVSRSYFRGEVRHLLVQTFVDVYDHILRRDQVAAFLHENNYFTQSEHAKLLDVSRQYINKTIGQFTYVITYRKTKYYRR